MLYRKWRMLNMPTGISPMRWKWPIHVPMDTTHVMASVLFVVLMITGPRPLLCVYVSMLEAQYNATATQLHMPKSFITEPVLSFIYTHVLYTIKTNYFLWENNQNLIWITKSRIQKLVRLNIHGVKNKPILWFMSSDNAAIRPALSFNP